MIHENNTNLQQWVADAEARWPAICYRTQRDFSSRAAKAAHYVETGQVEFVEYLPITGYDRWHVNGYECSIKQGACSCRDRAPVDAEAGSLCAHRLAILCVAERQAQHMRTLDGIFKYANGRTIRIEARVYYDRSVYRQRNVLVRYRIEGEKWRDLPSEIELTTYKLRSFLFRQCYRVQLGGRTILGRHAGGREQWIFETMPPEEAASGNSSLATQIDALFGVDAAISEERQRERNLRTLFSANIQPATAAV